MRGTLIATLIGLLLGGGVIYAAWKHPRETLAFIQYAWKEADRLPERLQKWAESQKSTTKEERPGQKTEPTSSPKIATKPKEEPWLEVPELKVAPKAKPKEIPTPESSATRREPRAAPEEPKLEHAAPPQAPKKEVPTKEAAKTDTKPEGGMRVWTKGNWHLGIVERVHMHDGAISHITVKSRGPLIWGIRRVEKSEFNVVDGSVILSLSRSDFKQRARLDK